MPLATNLAAVEYSTLMLFNFTVYKSFYHSKFYSYIFFILLPTLEC